MERQIRELYTDYRKGGTDRRTFLKKLGILTGSAYAASAMIPVLDSNYPFQDDDLVTEFIKYPAETGEMRAFMAYPKKGKKFPGVIVIHENRGLVPHIQDVTRRMAREGFLAMAPDALSPVGGTPEDVSNVGELFKKLNGEETVK